MAMNGKPKRYVDVKAEAVVRSLIDDEIHCLTQKAEPDKVRLLQVDVPAFAPSYLRRTLGKGVVVKFRDSDIIRKYIMPESREIYRLVREERDDVIASHTRTDDGFVYDRLTGLPCDPADFEAHVNACNRVLDMLQARE